MYVLYDCPKSQLLVAIIISNNRTVDTYLYIENRIITQHSYIRNLLLRLRWCRVASPCLSLNTSVRILFVNSTYFILFEYNAHATTIHQHRRNILGQRLKKRWISSLEYFMLLAAMLWAIQAVDTHSLVNTKAAILCAT